MPEMAFFKDEIKSLFCSRLISMKISGKVISGLGEGRAYMKKYKKNLEKALRMKLYPGTLNIATTKSYNFHKPIAVPAPAKNLFPVKCVKAKINKKIKGAIVMPIKTRHKNVIEIIAPVNLRKALKLKDGDMVEVEVKWQKSQR